MRICIVGGIFDKPAEYRAQHSISPETVLAGGLRRRGWKVVECGHADPLDLADCDLVHVHHFGRAALRLAARKQRPPFVLTTHDPFSMNRLPVGWKRRLTDRLVLHRADKVVALSNAEREFLMRRRRLAPERIAVIPNGINSAIFDRPAEPPASPGNLLLFVGQLKDFKGLGYLLDAMPAVRRSFPDVHLQIVYQTDAQLDRYLEQTAWLRLNGCVDFAGSRTAAALAQLYSTTAIVVAPSLGECLSTVVLEAMCCGAAVVATDVGGIREQLDDETGVIVPPRDADALAHAIRALLADHDRRHKMGAAARKKARAQFNIQKMIDRHVRLYEGLLYSDERAA